MTEVSEQNGNPVKKIKIENEESLKTLLNDFEFFKVLNENCLSKIIFIHAIKKKGNDEAAVVNDKMKENGNGKSENNDAVIIFERPHFSLDETKALLDQKCSQEIQLQNDIYNKLSIFPGKPFNSIHAQLIYPATEAHIIKYSSQEMFFVRESYEDWLNITSKWIKESSFNINWVYNILEHKTESERIIFEDSDEKNGFILLPDMKWNGQAETLYMLAIVHQKGIESLRSLTGEHISLLENIRDKSYAAIEEKFGLKKSKLRAYVHYQPSFYHLHIHFAHINHTLSGIYERNHQLNQIIENLKLDTDYYKKVSLEYALRKNEKLYELFKDRIE